MGDSIAGKRILLGVTGSIAAFKAVSLASELTKAGAIVDAVMTPSATKFVAPLSFQSITHRKVIVDLFTDASPGVEHVTLGDRADAVIVAPATANTIAHLALGLAEDALTTTVLASEARLMIAPAMESRMYRHPATQAHVQTLRERGAVILEPMDGRLASGRVGQGRMVEPSEIISELRVLLGRAGDLSGRRMVVTAGGTQEPIDPVRFIGNLSTGKMGYAIAEAARDRGAVVVLISAPSALVAPRGVEVRHVRTTREMQAAVELAVNDADALVMAAAVADYRVAEVASQKIKKTGDRLVLELVPNPDILAGLADRSLVKVGFAAETQDVLAHAREKLDRKKIDLIVANDVSKPGSGFATDTNEVILIDRSGAQHLPLLSKREVADRILDVALKLLPALST